jgi:sigma-B regulation protein RsbU (phosphoserine phosphatase)
VSRQIPSYLRLHIAEDTSRPVRRPQFADTTASFWHSFADATGWAVESRRNGGPVRLRSNVGVGSVLSADDMDDCPTISHDAALQLAEAGAVLTKQLVDAEELIRQQEARLAAAEVAPLVSAPITETPTLPGQAPTGRSADSRSLADRVMAVLKDGVEATGCEAAGLYLLDDETSQLKLRVSYGLPTSRLSAPPRQLRGSAADLEALVGSVVTLSDIARMPEWSSPEPFAAALCIAISVGSTPVGTLWMWTSRVTEFAKMQEAAMRLTAGLVASELSSDTLQRRVATATRTARPLKAASAWQKRQHPLDASLAPGWHAAGWTESASPLASTFYHWDVLPDGMLAMLIAEAQGIGFDAAMIAATTRAAWQSHSGYRHDPAQMLSRVSDTLWQTNTGDQLVSLLYAQINPDTGEGSCAAAGEISGIITSRYGFRPLIELSQPLGTQIDVRPKLHHLQLAKGETLFAYTAGLVNLSLHDARQFHLSQQRLAERIRDAGEAPPHEVLAAVRRLAAETGKLTRDRTVVAFKRD